MPVSPQDNLRDALIAAEDAGVPRKQMSGGSASQKIRVHRLINGEAGDVLLDPAIEIARNLPVSQQAVLARQFFPALTIKDDMGGTTATDLVAGAALALERIAALMTATASAAADGRITADEQRDITAKIQNARAQLDKLDAATGAVSVSRPARTR